MTDATSDGAAHAPAAYEAAVGASGRFIRAVDDLRRRFAAGLGVGMTEMRTMALLHENGPLTPSRIATSMKLSTGAVTALLDRLEANGAVARTAHPRDRRSTLIELTAAGRDAIGGNYSQYGALVAPVAALRTDDELRVISRFLDDLAAAFAKRPS